MHRSSLSCCSRHAPIVCLYHMVQVMSRGEMVEFDRPSRVLQQPHSLFRQMVDKTGDVAAKRLHEIAREADLGRNSEVYETTV